MQQKMNRIKQLVFVALAIQLAVVILLQLIFKLNILPGILVLIAEALIAVYLLEFFQSANEEESIGLEKYLGGSYADAYLVGGVGMMNYDENYVITWQSELFKEYRRCIFTLTYFINILVNLNINLFRFPGNNVIGFRQPSQ